jgi:hypothetical protein
MEIDDGLLVSVEGLSVLSQEHFDAAETEAAVRSQLWPFPITHVLFLYDCVLLVITGSTDAMVYGRIYENEASTYENICGSNSHAGLNA